MITEQGLKNLIVRMLNWFINTEKSQGILSVKPTRAGRILKASQEKTSAARQVLEEVGLDDIYDGSKYIVH